MKKKVVAVIMLMLLSTSMMTLVFNSAYGTCMCVNPDSVKYESETTHYEVSTLLTNLEYPKGLWVKGDNVFLTETAGRNTGYGGKICLDKYDILTRQKTVLVDHPECSDAVVVASDKRIYLTSYQNAIPGQNGKVSVVDPETNIETHLLNIEIASEDMFIDSNDDILIIGSSDLPSAKSIYLLPAWDYTNPIVLKTGLGRTWCISKSGTYTYFSDHSVIRRFNGRDGAIEMFVGKSVMSISFSSKYLFYADYFGGTVSRMDIETKFNETLVSGLHNPINVRYDELSDKLYFLEAGTSEGEYKDGTLKVITFNPSPSFAFIYSANLNSAHCYKTLLEAHGVSVDLVPNSTAETWDYSNYELILIGDDTGSLYYWEPAAAVSVINSAGKPILGLGEGGYAFFGKLGLHIGFGNGWHGGENRIYVVDAGHQIFNYPTSISIPPDRIIQLYDWTPNVGIYMPSPVEGVTPLGRESTDTEHYSLIQEDTRYVLWGFSNAPADMTQTGKDIFVNVILWLSGWTPQSTTRYSWPMLHHDLTHAGYSDSPAPNTNQTLWTYPTGGEVFTSPAVVDGKVYVGSYDCNVYCLDALTGTRIWNYTTGDGIESSPTVVDGRVYIGSNDYNVYCLDASSGALIWNHNIGYPLYSSPAVAYGRVYIGSFCCLNASTGALLWSNPIGSTGSSPAVVDGRVYAGSYNNNFYCLDAFSGAQIWNYTAGGNVLSPPAVVDGKVYVGSRDNKVYCLNALTGEQIWNYTTGGYVFSLPAVAYGKVYVGSYDNKLYCLDALTGERIWNCMTGGYVGSPCVADNKVYVVSLDGKMYCFDASTGAPIWSYETGGGLDIPPAVADGIVFVGSSDHKVYAFGNVVRVTENIQEAIDNAPEGAVLIVAVGVYDKSLVINKRLTLLGEKGSNPIFNGGGSGIAVTLLSGASGSTIAGIMITSWDQGILIDGASNCKIYDNIMNSIFVNGIGIEGASAVNNQIYSNIFENNSVAINLSTSSAASTIYKNIITSNTVGLSLQSGGNIIYTNTISDNDLGIDVTNSANNVIYHNNFANKIENAIVGAANNVWDDGYPCGGNYWSGYMGVDEKKGAYQNVPGSDGIGDTNYTIAANNIDKYPLMQPFNPHDIGIVNVITKTVVGQGFSLRIEVKILNYGIYDEALTVTAYANTTPIATQTIALAKRNSGAFTLIWNTSGFAKGNYTLSAYAWPVQGEIDTGDNRKVDGWVIVTIPGDATGDGVVDAKDLRALMQAWPPAAYNPKCDFSDDGVIDGKDSRVLGLNWGKTDP